MEKIKTIYAEFNGNKENTSSDLFISHQKLIKTDGKKLTLLILKKLQKSSLEATLMSTTEKVKMRRRTKRKEEFYKNNVTKTHSQLIYTII